MGLVVLVEADFSVGPLGLASLLDAELDGIPVLRRTVLNLAAADVVEKVVVAVQPEDTPKAVELLDDAEYVLHETGKPDLPYRAELRWLRRWAKNCWRGGLKESTVFSEIGNPEIMFDVAKKYERDFIAVHPASSPLVDAAMLKEMEENFDPEKHFYLVTNSPPGMHEVFYSRRFVDLMCKSWIPLDVAMRLNRSDPAREPEAQDLVHLVDGVLGSLRGRFSADSKRSLAFLERAYDSLGQRLFSMPFNSLAGFFHAHREIFDDTLPEELEVELTTRGPGHWARPLPGIRSETDLSFELFTKLINDLEARDDILITCGGFGDPLYHPRFADCLAAIGQTGAFGVHVKTTLDTLTDENLEVLLAHADVVSVSLDAAEASTYNSLFGRDRFDAVEANLARLTEATRGNGGFPIIVSEFTRIAGNEPEWEDFWNAHLESGRVPLVRGFDHYAGQVVDRAVLPLLPGKRVACALLENEMFIAADGTVPVCRVDFKGTRIAGSIRSESVSDIWNSPALSELRSAHRRGKYGDFGLCENCRSWASVF